MRISTNQVFRVGLAGVTTQQGQHVQAQRQLVSGSRINTAADDPAAAATAARLDHRVNDLGQFDRNIVAARSNLNMQDEAIGRVTDRLQRLREIAIAAENGANSNSDLRSYAVEVGEIRDEVLDLANTKDGAGRYAFSGFQSLSRPFADVGGAVVYSGDQGQRELQVGATRHLVVAEPGSRVFEDVRPGNGQYQVGLVSTNVGTGVLRDEGPEIPGSFPGNYEIRFTSADQFDVVDMDAGATLIAGQAYRAEEVIAFGGARVSIEGRPEAGDVFTVSQSRGVSVFALIDRLQGSLEAGASDAAGMARLSQGLNNSIRDLDQSLDQLLAARGRLGARLAGLEGQESSNGDLALVNQEALSELRDLDYAAAISEFNRFLTGLQAAQQTFARMQEISLFSLLR